MHEQVCEKYGFECRFRSAQDELAGRDPYELFDLSNEYAGCVQDRCLLYVFKCAVYFAETPPELHDTEKLKWWYWKDQ